MAQIKQTHGNDELVDQITKVLKKARLNEADLDDSIHDIADHFGSNENNLGRHDVHENDWDTIRDEWSAQASKINNSGMEEQVRAILCFHGIKGGIETLNAIISESAGKNADLIEMPQD